jgi:transposase
MLALEPGECTTTGKRSMIWINSPAAASRWQKTAKLNDVDPQAWLADVLARLQDHAARRIAELLPWNWKALQQSQQRAAA